MKDIAIFGCGGMGGEILSLIHDINSYSQQYNVVGFVVDDEYYIKGNKVEGFPVYSREWLLNHRDDLECACAIGYPKDRRKVMESLSKDGIRFETLIHPTSGIRNKESIGEGSTIQSHSLVGRSVTLGKGVFLNSMVCIGHNCCVGDYVTCFPKSQISGGCKIGEAALIGSMAFINERRKIGKEAVVAPGSIVFRSVKDERHVMGNPAKEIKL